MREITGNFLFLLAGILWGIELIPQLIQTIKTKNVQGISIFFLMICFFAYLLFIIGAGLIKNKFLFVSHLIPFCNVTILCYLTFKYKNRILK